MTEEKKTPAAQWRADGQEDPHGTDYDCERAKLALGDFTDDQLANAVFMYGNSTPRMDEVLAGKARMPIVYLTAAKERIRWLSRALENTLAEVDRLKKERDEMAQLLRGDGEPYGYWREGEWYGYHPDENAVDFKIGETVELVPVWTHAQPVTFKVVGSDDSDDISLVPASDADAAMITRKAIAEEVKANPAQEENKLQFNSGEFKPRELVTLNGAQLKSLVDATNGDLGPDPDTEITLIAMDTPFKSTDGEEMPAGTYFYWTEYPEEGIVHISDIEGQGEPG